MKNRIKTIVFMALWMMFLIFQACASVPPRHLTLRHMQQFSLIPLGAFLVALPDVPKRWYAYFSVLCVAPLIAMFAYHIRGTSSRLAWDEGIARFFLPILIIVAVVTASTLAAWLRQVIQTEIGKLKRHANQPLERTSQ
jgi:hypothetical protein